MAGGRWLVRSPAYVMRRRERRALGACVEVGARGAVKEGSRGRQRGRREVVDEREHDLVVQEVRRDVASGAQVLARGMVRELGAHAKLHQAEQLGVELGEPASQQEWGLPVVESEASLMRAGAGALKGGYSADTDGSVAAWASKGA
ncbi:hypothetical protein ACSSS7_007695 [Eimeria intestinalis]